ncbi:MAG: hypothetical protein ACI8UO_005951, partial [Verrucomicrobiales bacterium]
MKTLTLLLALVVATAHAQNKPDPNVQAAERALGILESATWNDLFNGKDLEGWTGDTEGYVAKDGILVCQKGGKVLQTEKDYADFAFSFEFKLEDSGNNGIGIRVADGGHASRDGMEIQVLDHNGKKYQGEVEIDGKKRKLSWLKPWQYHGSLYGIYPAKTGYLKPAGEWNQETIIAIDDHIVVILNGAVIVDVFLDDVTPVDGNPHLGMRSKTGRIQFAGHSDPAQFRNIKLADFTPSAPLPKTEKDNTPPAGFAAVFNGKDLDGWKGLAHGNANERRALEGDALKEAQAAADEVMNAHWSAVDGVLTYDGTGKSLCTAKDFGDFEMYIDWKIPAGADSGIYLRGTPQIQIWDPWKPQSKDKGAPLPSTAEDWVASYRNGQNLGSGSLWNNRQARNSPLTNADKRL